MMGEMIKAGSYYIPLHNVREIYFSQINENILNVVRNTVDAAEIDREEYELSIADQMNVLSKLEKLSR